MNLGEMLDELVLSVGNDDDEVRTVLTRGVNAGIIIATLRFHPVEYKGTGQFTLAANNGYVSLANTDWLEIDNIWNGTADKKVWSMSYDELMTFDVLFTEDVVTYYAVYGDYTFVRPIVTTNTVLIFAYFRLPDRVSSEGDSIPLDKHLEFIMSTAMEYYWASQEENESSQMWQGVCDRIGAPLTDIANLQRALKKEPPYGNKLQGTV